MTMSPRFDSPDPRTRKIMYYVCDITGKCFSTTEINALAGSFSVPSPKRVNRLDTELDLSEILLGEKKHKKERTEFDKHFALAGSNRTSRLNRDKSLSELLGAV